MDIYRAQILDHYKNPRNWGKLKDKTGSATLSNSSCGDTMTVEVDVEKGILKDMRFTGQGCAISIAAASLLSENIIGNNVQDILQIGAVEIEKFLGTKLTPTRVKCATLGLEGVKTALAKSG